MYVTVTLGLEIANEQQQLFELKAELTGCSCLRSVGQTFRTFHGDTTSLKSRKQSVLLNGLNGFQRTDELLKVSPQGLNLLLLRSTVLGKASRAWLKANWIVVFRPVCRRLLSYRLVSAWGSRTRNSSHKNPLLTCRVAIRAGRIIRPQRPRFWQFLGASSTCRQSQSSPTSTSTMELHFLLDYKIKLD